VGIATREGGRDLDGFGAALYSRVHDTSK